MFVWKDYSDNLYVTLSVNATGFGPTAAAQQLANGQYLFTNPSPLNMYPSGENPTPTPTPTPIHFMPHTPVCACVVNHPSPQTTLSVYPSPKPPAVCPSPQTTLSVTDDDDHTMLHTLIHTLLHRVHTMLHHGVHPLLPLLLLSWYSCPPPSPSPPPPQVVFTSRTRTTMTHLFRIPATPSSTHSGGLSIIEPQQQLKVFKRLIEPPDSITCLNFRN